MKEVDVYISGVKMETIKNLNVSVSIDDYVCTLGTEAIGKLKVVTPFKPFKTDKYSE